LAFPQLERRIESVAGETLFQSARRHGVRIVGACGGRGTCGSCEVRVIEGEVAAWTPASVSTQAPVPPPAGPWLRACPLPAASDCTIEIAPRSLATVVRTDAEAGGDDELVALDAAVSACDVEMPAPTLADSACDADRVLRALGASDASIDIEAARELPRRLR